MKRLRRFTPEEAIEELKNLPRDDPETAHAAADEVLCGVLRDLGGAYAEVAAAWRQKRRQIGFLCA